MEVLYRTGIKTHPRTKAKYLHMSSQELYLSSDKDINSCLSSWDLAEVFSQPDPIDSTTFWLRLSVSKIRLSTTSESKRDFWVKYINERAFSDEMKQRRHELWRDKWTVHVHLVQGWFLYDKNPNVTTQNWNCQLSIGESGEVSRDYQGDSAELLQSGEAIGVPSTDREPGWIRPLIYKSEVISKDVTPVWNQIFAFAACKESESIVVDCFDRRKGYLGTGRVSIGQVLDKGKKFQEPYEDAVGLEAWVEIFNEYPKKDSPEPKRLPGRINLRIIIRGAEHCQDHRYPLDKTLWLSSRYRARKYGFEAPVTVWHGSWNMGDAPPPSDQFQLSCWLRMPKNDQSDPILMAVGCQEAEYDPRMGKQSCDADWIGVIKDALCPRYRLLKHISLWAIRLAVFVREDHYHDVALVKSCTVATGIANVLGNKGGSLISLMFRHTHICFVNSHLAAHQGKTKARVENIRDIITGSVSGIGYGTHDLMSQFHYVFWGGDLNFRLNYGEQKEEKAPNEEDFYELSYIILKGQKYAQLLQIDQLRLELKNGVLHGFTDEDLLFPPTFKLERGVKQEYSDNRSPAWCDRVLHRALPGVPPVKLKNYKASFNVLTSDHKPVNGLFEIKCWFHESAEDLSIIRIEEINFSKLLLTDWKDEFKKFGVLEAFISSEFMKEDIVQELDDAMRNHVVSRKSVTVKFGNIKRLARAIISFDIRQDMISIGQGGALIFDLEDQIAEIGAGVLSRPPTMLANMENVNYAPSGSMRLRAPLVSKTMSMNLAPIINKLSEPVFDPLVHQRAQQLQSYQKIDLNFSCPITYGSNYICTLQGVLRVKCLPAII